MSIEVHIFEGPLGEPSVWQPDGAGAVVCFDGVVRPLEEDRLLEALDYEAYRPMAERSLESLAEHMVSTHGLLGICVEHSVGSVPVGSCSFRLRVAAEHRAEALAAMDQFIVQMKKDVPIWKKPVWAKAEVG